MSVVNIGVLAGVLVLVLGKIMLRSDCNTSVLFFIKVSNTVVVFWDLGKSCLYYLLSSILIKQQKCVL